MMQRLWQRLRKCDPPEPDYPRMEVEHRLEALELQLTIMERDEKAHDLRLLHDELRRMQYPDQEHLGRT